MTRRWAALGALYLAMAMLFVWPLPLHLGTHLWGDRFDAWTTLWLIAHLGETLTHPSAHTDQILYPIGYNLFSFGHLALQAMAAPFVRLGLSPVLAYNALALGALTFSALSAHALGEALAGPDPRVPERARLAAGLVAATVFTYNPYLYGELRAGCLELVAAGFLPLFLRALLRLSDRPTARGVATAAVILAITGPFNWYYALFTGMLGVAFAGLMLLQRRPLIAAATVASLSLGALMVAPLIPIVRRETPPRPPISAEQFTPERWEAARELSDGVRPLAQIGEQDLLDLDAIQVVLNSTSASALLAMDFPTNPLDSTPGRLAWGLGLVGAAAAGRRGARWLAGALLFTGLTLGPYALIDQSPPLPTWSLDHPLPYLYAYNDLPFFSKAYRPYRIGVVALTLLAAAASAGVYRLILPRDPAEPRFTRAGVGLAGALLLIGASQPLWVEGRPAAGALADARLPEAYRRLAGREGAIIELPLHYQPLSVAASMVQAHQLLHHRPILNCNQLIRRTELIAFRDYVGQNAFLTTILDLARAEPPWSFSGADIDALLADGFRDLTVRTRLPAEAEHLAGHQESADQLGLAALRVLTDSFGPPWLDEGGLMAFELRPQPPGARRWDGERVRALPVAAARLGLPVYLAEGQQLELGAGEGGVAAAGVWARVTRGQASLNLRSEKENKTVSTPEDPDHWVWLRLQGADDPGPWSLSLEGPGEILIARPEVERR